MGELTPKERAERRRRLAEAFGEVLPDQTGDDREPADRAGRERREEEWLRGEVPPHHGS